MAGMTAGVVPRFRELRYRAYHRRMALPAAAKVALAVGMAGLTGVLAQLRIPLFPVPITGQVFAVLLAGVLLGGLYGGLSQAVYVGLGAAGVPWFTAFGAGMGWLAGPTGGYLVGFVLAAALIGHLSESRVAARRFLPQVGIMAMGVAVIYACGTLHLAAVLRLGWREAFSAGVLPFIGVDALKALLAAAVGTALLPKRP